MLQPRRPKHHEGFDFDFIAVVLECFLEKFNPLLDEVDLGVVQTTG